MSEEAAGIGGAVAVAVAVAVNNSNVNSNRKEKQEPETTNNSEMELAAKMNKTNLDDDSDTELKSTPSDNVSNNDTTNALKRSSESEESSSAMPTIGVPPGTGSREPAVSTNDNDGSDAAPSLREDDNADDNDNEVEEEVKVATEHSPATAAAAVTPASPVQSRPAAAALASPSQSSYMSAATGTTTGSATVATATATAATDHAESESEDAYPISCFLHPTTPIPNSDSSLRLLRKFIQKTAPSFPVACGGSKTTSFFAMLFGGNSGNGAGRIGKSKGGNGDVCCAAYKHLVDILLADMDGTSDTSFGGDDTDPNLNLPPTPKSATGNNGEDQIVIDSILGHAGDTMSKARLAMASFIRLLELFSLDTQRMRMVQMGAAGIPDDTNADSTSMEEYVHMVQNSKLIHVQDVCMVNEQDGSVIGIASGNGVVDVTEYVMACAWSCAEGLVAHGCLDGVLLGVAMDTMNPNAASSSLDNDAAPIRSVGGSTSMEEEIDIDNDVSLSFDHAEEDIQYMEAVTILCESIFKCFFHSEEVELAALKFLLTTGCRTTKSTNNSGTGEGAPRVEAMIKGSFLLQAIRVCYRLYLSTESAPNKTTAKAALRQIVTSTFKRLEMNSDSNSSGGAAGGVTGGNEEDGEDPFSNVNNNVPIIPDDQTIRSTGRSFSEGFKSFEHKDAYLVLRSLCKLSMKAVPVNSDMTGSGNSSNLSGGIMSRNESSIIGTPSRGNASKSKSKQSDLPPIPIEMMMDPALDSKILALDLILEILQRTQTSTLLNAGPNLIYAVRNYLCHSLLKNCTLDNTYVVNLSLRLFVPLIQHFRSHLKTEIEAFVTNVFFVILDSKNSSIEHKLRVVVLFEEICSDSNTLAEIFLNYDCDLSAVDLFQRIVNSLARVAKIGLHDQGMEAGGGLFVSLSGAGASRAERTRQDHRALRLEAMRAVRQILSSLYGSMIRMTNDANGSDVVKMMGDDSVLDDGDDMTTTSSLSNASDRRKSSATNLAQVDEAVSTPVPAPDSNKKSLVQIYDSKKKRKEEFEKAVLKYSQKPTTGIKYAATVGIIPHQGKDPADVASFLITHKDVLDKTQTGEYLGREPSYQDGFALKVLHDYAAQLDFSGLRFDEGIKFYLSGFRLPGEAQKIDRIMEKFAERYTVQNPDVFPNADAAFILAFSVIMLNTDLHNPAIKEDRRMTKEGFVRNNSGICDGQDLPKELLMDIFDKIQSEPISLKEDDEARLKVGGDKNANDAKSNSGSGIFGSITSNFEEMEKQRETDFEKERDEMLRSTESLLRRKKKGRRLSVGRTGTGASSNSNVNFVSTQESGLKDEYVIPMFDVTWGPALAVFSTVIESANGTTMGALLSIATDHEIEAAAENAATATEVCLSGFRLAIRIAALCGNVTARSAYVHALSNFSLLGSGRLLEHRHIRCVQTMLELGRDDGELLSDSWEYVFKALSEVARLNSVYEVSARHVRAEAAAHARRRRRIIAEQKAAERRAELEEMAELGQLDNADGEQNADGVEQNMEEFHEDEQTLDSFDSVFTDELLDDNYNFDEELDKKIVDEMNARAIHETIAEDLSDEIFSRSSTLSTVSIKEFVFQLCRVSRMEIAGYGGHVGSKANDVDLTAVHYRKQHTLLVGGGTGVVSNQPDIYCLQKLVEVTHYNMDTRPRLVFSDMWNNVSGHLTSTALHTNAAVAMYAVDSFRQLSMQFLKRQELGVFEFQRKFIKPFEGIMPKCNNPSVKEYLLKAVEQIIILYGSDENISDNGDGSGNDTRTQQKGLLKSGWRPLLAVIGQASGDEDDAIAKLGFAMLTEQLRQSLKVSKAGTTAGGDASNTSIANTSATNDTFTATSPMRADKFVDLVEALLMYVGGPREEMSTISIDHLVTLCKYLADDSIPLPQSSKAAAVVATSAADGPDAAASLQNPHSHSSPNANELELWWPILLGLSKSVGDPRPNIRIKGLITLLAIINQHFFTVSGGKSSNSGSVLSDIQTLQLVFRGILLPTLEHAETISVVGTKLPLPDGFIRFMTRGTAGRDMPQGGGGRKDRIEGNAGSGSGNTWLDTTFDHLMDGAIAAALKSIEVYKEDTLIEEVLAMFNTCLVSDSASMAIRGLKRLYHFVANDLVLEGVTQNTWATVCHMLRRCLAVSGLPFNPETSGDVKLNSEIVNDFLQEEEFLPLRRYIGSNATSIIGSLLTDKQIVESMGQDWYLFLYSGLGMGIRTWDKAAEIVDMHPLQSRGPSVGVSPPQYAENSLYARKWMVKLLLKLVSGEDVVFGSQSTTDLKSKNLLRQEFKSLVNSFLKKEAATSGGNASPGQVLEIDNMTKMVCSLLEGMSQLDTAHLSSIKSLTPMLSACIQINDRTIRTAVHGLLTRIFELSEDTSE